MEPNERPGRCDHHYSNRGMHVEPMGTGSKLNVQVHRRPCPAGWRVQWWQYAIPGVLRVLDDLLAVLAPLVAVVEHVDVAHRLEAEPRLAHLPPRLPSAARLLHPHRADPQRRRAAMPGSQPLARRSAALPPLPAFLIMPFITGRPN